MNNFVREVDCNQPDQESLTSLELLIQRFANYDYPKAVRSKLGVDVPNSIEGIVALLRRPTAIEGRAKTRRAITEVHARVKYLGGRVCSQNICIFRIYKRDGDCLVVN